jgi:hypothetical protein
MAELKRHEKLVVITKTYDQILWSCHHTSKFSRNHRLVLGERIERNLYELLETLLRAKYTRQRQPMLEQANLVLEILRFQMRLAPAENLSRLRAKEITPSVAPSAPWPASYLQATLSALPLNPCEPPSTFPQVHQGSALSRR